MTGRARYRRLVGALTACLFLIGGVLASCGETRPIAASSLAPIVAPVLKITVPPGHTPLRVAVSPTPRVPLPVLSVSRTPTPHGDPPCVFSSESCISPTPVPTSPVPLSGAAEAGRRQFTEKGCVACHGTDLNGGIGPQLADRTPADLTDSRIEEQIMQGGNGMPAFPKTTRQELHNFIALIRSRT